MDALYAMAGRRDGDVWEDEPVVGYFPRNGVMEDVFSKAAFGLEKGAISAPVTSNFGVHLIRVTGEKAGEKDWTDVRDQLKAPVSQQLFNDLAAKERGKGSGKNAPKPFYVYLDEFQRFITPTIAENLDEARGFGLHMTLAHQFPTQLSESGPRGKRLFRSVMVNTHSKVVMGLEDRTEIEPLAEWLFTGSIDTEAVKFDLKTSTFPVFPGNHGSILDEQPGHPSFLDHLVASLR